jgi:23S rRNA (adenine2503-C2)-methyltransferase
MPTPTDLKNLTQFQLAEFFGVLGLPPSRARQVFRCLHRPGTRDVAGLSTVKRTIRESLAEHASISSLEPARVQRSRDGTVKFAFRLGDGATIESVLIPADGRHTLCVSSQAGCAMGCRFCLTAGMGFQRNLTPAEIVNQVAAAQVYMIQSGVIRATARQLIDNLVFMGMGEPLANYDNLVAALTILMDEQGPGYSERRITVSTCGLAPRIGDLGRDIRVNLAVSLHAADDATRNSLMPVNRAFGVDEVLAACRAYPLSKRQVIFIEYVLIEGLNDSAAAARKLAEKLQGIRCRVNLLPYNESPSLPYRCSPQATIAAFQDVLGGCGLRTLIRASRGSDIAAACGQLAADRQEADIASPEPNAR